MQGVLVAWLGILGIGLAACATEGRVATLSEEAADKLAAFEPTGEMTNCLNSRLIQEVRPLNETLILVRTGANAFWLNRTTGRCNNAESSFSRLQYRNTTSQLCRGQIVQVIDNTTGSTVGSCSFGDFERLEAKEAPAGPS